MRKRVFGGLALVLASIMTLAACGGSTNSSASSSPSTFTFGIDQDMVGFNILQAQDSEFVLQEVMNNVWPQVFLTTPSLTEQLDTNYVTSATVTSTSPQTVVYDINPKATWSDGVPISASDFIYNWQAQSGNPKYKDVGGQVFEAASTAGYNQIKSVTGSNGGKTVTVVFAKPFGDWKSLFTNLVPAHIAEKVGFNNGFQTFNSAVQVSGGPFEIQSYTKGQSVIEVPNPKWWGAPVKLGKLVFRIFSDDNQMPPAMQNGEVDAVNPAQASLQFKDAVAGLPNFTTSIIPGLEFQHLDFNEANPYLAKVAVRQAIAYGTNRAEMVSRIVGPITSSAKPLENRIYMPSQPQYSDTSGSYGAYAPAKAKSLLASAGMKMGSDGYYHPNFGPLKGKDLTLNVSTTTGEPVRAEIEQLFQADMKAIGVKINIQNYAPKTLFGTIAPKSEYDIIQFAWVATPFASAMQPIYCSYTNPNVCGQNWVHYANPQVDSLFNQALTTVDPAKAAALYNQIDSILWKDMVTLPLFQQPQLYSWNATKWANIEPNPSNVGLTWNAFEWAPKS